MARKNQLKSTGYPCIKELEMLDGTFNYIAIFSYNGTRYGEKNLTKLSGASSARQASELLKQIKVDLSRKIDVFSSKSEKIDYLVITYLNSRDKSYRINNRALYKNHIQGFIGHRKIDLVTRENLIQIRTKMEQGNLSPNTIKKVRTLLSPIFKEALASGIITHNILLGVKFGEDRPKPELVDRISEPLLDAIKKIYITTMNEENEDFKIVLLISIMCGRRIGEIVQINYEDIIDGVVQVRASTTKTYKNLHPDATAERFPLPKEVLKLIGTGAGKIIKYKERAYMDKYAKLIDTKCKLKLKPLAKQYPIRSHDNRNFLMSIQKKKFGRDLVGSACLSHSNKSSDMNARYDSLEYSDIEAVHKDYWKKLRANTTKSFAQSAVEEQLNEIEKENMIL